MRPRASICGFTLIELLVVIAIIGILTGLLFPSVRNALGKGKAVNSMSNMRQWGQALHLAMADASNDLLPWDGPDAVSAAIGNTNWWANLLPPYVGEPSYLEITKNSQGKKVPLPPEKSMFIDPSAKKPANAPYKSGQVSYFFCYVINSKLNQSLAANERLNLSSIPNPSATALMVEMRTVPEELPAGNPYRSRTLDRAKADWQRFRRPAQRRRAYCHGRRLRAVF